MAGIDIRASDPVFRVFLPPFSRTLAVAPSGNGSVYGRFSLNLVEAGWLTLTVVTPLYFNLFSQGIFENHKIALLRAVTLLMVAAWTVYRLDAGTAGSRLWRHPIALPLLVFAISQSLSTAFSIGPWHSLWGLPTRQGGLVTILCYLTLFLLVARHAVTPEQHGRTVDFSIYASLPVSLYALAQFFGVDPVNWGAGLTYRVTSTLGNPIFLSAYLTMVLLATLGRMAQIAAAPASTPAERLHRHWRGSALLLLLLLQFSAIWLSYSRGPLLALLVALAAMAIILYRRQRESGRPSVPWCTLSAMVLTVTSGVGIGLVVVFALGLLPMPGLSGAGTWIRGLFALGAAAVWLVMRRLARGLDLARPVGAYVVAMTLLFGIGFDLDVSRDDGPNDGGTADLLAFGSMGQNMRDSLGRIGSVQERLWYWQGYRDAFLDGEALQRIPGELDEPPASDPLHPLRFWFGYGQEQGDILFQRHYPRHLAQYHPPSKTVDRAHNSVWDLLLTGGVVALAAFLWLLQCLFARGLTAVGFTMHRRGRRRFALLFWIGSTVGGFSAGLIFGLHMLGVGTVVGAVTAVLLYLLFGDLRRSRGETGQNRLPWMSAGLFAAMLSHVAEGAVSFGVASTDLLFWLFAGLLVSRAATGVSAGGQERGAGSPPPSTWPVAAVATGLPLGVLVFVFLLLPPAASFSGPQSALVLAPTGSLFAEGVGSAWTAGASVDRLLFFYVGLMAISWLWMLFGTIRPSVAEGSGFIHDLGRIAVGSLAVIGLAVLFVVWNQQQLSTAQHLIEPESFAGTVLAIVRQVGILEQRVVYFYLWVGVVLLVLAGCLSLPLCGSVRPPSVFTVVSAALLCILWAWAVVPISLRPVQSDMTRRSSVLWRNGDMTPLLQGTDFLRQVSGTASLVLAVRSARLAPSIAEHWVSLADNASSMEKGVIEQQGRDPLPPLLPALRQDPDELTLGDPSSLAQYALHRAHGLRPFDPMQTRHRALLSLRLGGSEERERRQREVQGWLEMAGKVMNGHPAISNDLALIRLRALGDPEGALAALEGALESPNAPLATYQLRAEARWAAYGRDCGTTDAGQISAVEIPTPVPLPTDSCRQRLESVLNAWADIVQLAPQEDRATEGLFKTLHSAGRTGEAFRALEAGLIRTPESRRLAALLSHLMRNAEFTAPAIRLLKSVVKARPKAVLPRILLARVYIDSDKEAAALDLLEGVAAEEGLSSGERREIASLYLRLHRPYDGFRSIRQILRRSPADAPAWSLAARVLSGPDNSVEGAKALEQAVRWSSSKSRALNCLQRLESRYLRLGMDEQVSATKRRVRALIELD